MPIEGIDTTTDSTLQNAEQQTTSDATEKTTDAGAAGADTQTAQTTEAQKEKTFTQADVDRIVTNRIKSGVKAELKKLTGEGDGTPTVEELQRQLSEERTSRQTIEAREAVRDYLSDAKHKLNIKAENVAAIMKLVMSDIEFDDKGNPSNLKEAVETAKSLAPALFVNTPASINAGAGRNGAVVGNDMNDWIRRQRAGG